MVFKYNPDSQKKYDAPARESLINIDKKFQLKIDGKSASDTTVRILPPWSEEGSIIKGTKYHFLMSKMFICPDVLGEHQCRFCLEKATKMSGKENYEKYKPDADEIRAKAQYIANAGHVDSPATIMKGVLVFAFGTQIYDGIMAIQRTGRWGDISDVMEGRNLFIQRRINSGRVVDSVQALPEITTIPNENWVDDIHDLDEIFPEPMPRADVERMFAAYPWKVYEPTVSVQVPRTYDGTPEAKKETKKESIHHQEPEVKKEEPSTPPTATAAEDVAARLRAKLAKAKEAAQ